MGETIAVAAEEVAPGPVQHCHSPTAGDTVHNAGADEIGARATKATGRADDADCLGYILPIVATNAHSVGEMQPVGVGAQIDRSVLCAVV